MDNDIREKGILELVSELMKSPPKWKPEDIKNRLIEIGAKAIPELIRALKELSRRSLDRNKGDIFDTIEIICEIDPSGYEDIFEIIENPGYGRFRNLLIEEIGKKKKKVAIPTLIKILKNKDEEISHKAMWAIGEIGVENKEIRDILISSIINEDGSISNVVMQTLEKLGTKIPIPVLREVILTREREVYHLNISKYIIEKTQYYSRKTALNILIDYAQEEREALFTLIDILGCDELEFKTITTNFILDFYFEKQDHELLEALKEKAEIHGKNSLTAWIVEELERTLQVTDTEQQKIDAILYNIQKELERNFEGKFPTEETYEAWEKVTGLFEHIQELVKVGAREAIPLLIKLLRAVYSDEGDCEREIIKEIGKLGKRGRIASYPLVQEIYESIYEGEYGSFLIEKIAVEVVDTLVKIDSLNDASLPLAGLLEWISKNCMYEAYQSEGGFKEDDSAEAVVGLKVIDLFAKLKNEKTLPALVRTIRGSIGILERKAVWALGEIGGKEAIIPLIRVKWGVMPQYYSYDVSDVNTTSYSGLVDEALQVEASSVLKKLGINREELFLYDVVIDILSDGKFEFYGGNIDWDMLVKTAEKLKKMKSLEMVYQAVEDFINQQKFLNPCKAALELLGLIGSKEAELLLIDIMHNYQDQNLRDFAAHVIRNLLKKFD